jgi:hypothetical protein
MPVKKTGGPPSRIANLFRRLRIWLHPYAGICSAAGIFVVLITFVVKDVLKDREKDIVESLEAAKTKWLLITRIGVVDSRLVAFQQELENWRSEAEDDIQKREYGQISTRTLALVDGVFEELKATSLISENLSPDPNNQHRTTVAGLNDVFVDLKKRCNKICLEAQTQTLSVSTNPKENRTPLQQAIGELNDVRIHLLQCESDLKAEESLEVVELEDDLKSAGSNVSIFTFASWVLYPLGVLIGVVGHVAGAKGLQAEE